MRHAPTWATPDAHPRAAHRYRVAGITLGSSRPLPGLEPARGGRIDVEVSLDPDEGGRRLSGLVEGVRWRAHPIADEAGRPVVEVRRAGAWFRFVYCDGCEFAVKRDGTRIRGTWPAHYTPEDAAAYLAGPVLGFLLRLRGRSCLHAAAVCVDGGAVILLGPSGAGKSTLAAAFALRGHGVLCDDAAALRSGEDGLVWVEPGSTRVRLWEETAQRLCPDHHPLPRLTPNWDKRYLELREPGDGRARRAAPIVAAFLLGPRRAQLRGPRLVTLSPREALLRLVAHSYGGCLLGASMRAREFLTLAALAESVPFRHLHAPACFERLPAVVDRILAATRRTSHARGGKR